MKVYQDLSTLPPITNAVLTIGTFDGVHLGHQQIIRQLIETARMVNGETVILTFHPHPRKINDVLDKVGLKSKGFKMPFEMSGGEQQRVDIARALLNSPKLILADEPTGNLDPETSDEIMQLLFQIAEDYGASIIMATHDFIVINRYPSRMLKTENGKVTDSGYTYNTQIQPATTE